MTGTLCVSQQINRLADELTAANRTITLGKMQELKHLQDQAERTKITATTTPKGT